MKKHLMALACLTALALPAMAEQPVGIIFKEAVQAGGGSGGGAAYKVGCSECTSYFGIVAKGDCSLQTAMKNGKIKRLSHYDEDVLNILGFKKIKVRAYGQ